MPPSYTHPTLAFENENGRPNGVIVCGVDEVGRGPLAGPVMAAAAIIPPEGLPDAVAARVNDSKKLSERQREDLFPTLAALCPHAVAEASVAEIDSLNILRATLLAMRRAVEALPQPAGFALIDGNKMPLLPCPGRTIVKGDAHSLSIAVASILAKVTRDRFMKKIAADFPVYGWAENAGYPTAAHRAALERFGVTPWHRRSFGPVAKVVGHSGVGIRHSEK
jgi:ribonuclease HII